MLPPAFHGMPTPAGVQRFRFVGDEMQNRVMALPRRLDDGHLKTVGDALAAVIGMHEDAGQPWGEILALMIVAGPQAGEPMRMPPFPGGHPPKPGFCHGGELFCATSASDNPVETINKLTAVIPAGSAKHYEVRVAVVAVPDAPPAP